MRRPVPFVLALLSVVLAACGSGNDGKNAATTGDTKAAPTRAEFIEQGDALCQKSNIRAKRQNTRVQAVAEAAPDDATGLAKLAPLLREGLEDQQADVRAFERLTPPAGEEKQARKIAGLYGEQTALLTKLTEAAQKGDVQGVNEALAEQQPLKERVGNYVHGYGFKECGSGNNEADAAG
jgi:phage tail protein X